MAINVHGIPSWTGIKLGGDVTGNSSIIQKIPEIITNVSTTENNLVICSAGAGQTRNLMRTYNARKRGQKAAMKHGLDEYYQTHEALIEKLFTFKNKEWAIKKLDEYYYRLCNELKKDPSFAKVVGFGEITSTRIISMFLSTLKGFDHSLLDAYQFVRTRESDNPHYDIMDIEATEKLMREKLAPQLKRCRLNLMQGFIGRRNKTNQLTVLELDGSDMSAATAVYSLYAKEALFIKKFSVLNKPNESISMQRNFIPELMHEGYVQKCSKDGCYPVFPDSIALLAKRKKAIQARVVSYNDLYRFQTIIK